MVCTAARNEVAIADGTNDLNTGPQNFFEVEGVLVFERIVLPLQH